MYSIAVATLLPCPAVRAGAAAHSDFFLCVCQVDDEPDPVSLGVCGVGQPPQGLKRKADTPLGSPPEPGQVLQQQDDDGRGARYKIRVRR